MMISLGLPSTCSFFWAERSGFASLPQPATGLAASANTLRAPSRSGHPSGSDPPEVPAESDVRRRPASDKERRVGGSAHLSPVVAPLRDALRSRGAASRSCCRTGSSCERLLLGTAAHRGGERQLATNAPIPQPVAPCRLRGVAGHRILQVPPGGPTRSDGRSGMVLARYWRRRPDRSPVAAG